IIYVSSSTGDDGNDGLTPTTPKRTIAAGYDLLRDGYPDWLLLRCGDVWHENIPAWNRSGRSATEPAVLWNYGSGSRPLLLTGSMDGWRSRNGNASLSHIAVI